MKELIEIQQALKAPKGQYNSFGKYNYRSCEDILEAVKPLLHKHECYITLNDDITQIGERYYIKATASVTNKDGKVVSVTAYARESENKAGMDASQITGTASSYARKYALNGLFCIDDTKDADTDEYVAKTTKAEQKTQATKQSETPKKKTDKKTLGDVECQSIELTNQIYEWVYKNKYMKTHPKENFSFFMTISDLYNIPSQDNMELLIRGWADFLELKKMTPNG